MTVCKPNMDQKLGLRFARHLLFDTELRQSRPKLAGVHVKCGIWPSDNVNDKGVTS